MSEAVRPHVLSVPVSAERPVLNDMMSTGEAFCIIHRNCLAHINANVPAVIARDSEGLHQARVGLRRLRTALKLVAKSDALEVRAKELIGAIGVARDLDVFRDELFGPAIAALGARRGFDILTERLDALRAKAWQSAVSRLTHPALAAFDADIDAFAQSQPEGGLLRITAPIILDRARKRAQKRGRHFAELDPPARHRLRIALKTLRYTSEFFAALYPGKRLKPWLQPLKDLQDELGYWNDLAQLRGTIGRLLLDEARCASAQADLSYAGGLLLGFHQARGDVIAEKAGKRWRTFRKADPFWI